MRVTFIDEDTKAEYDRYVDVLPTRGDYLYVERDGSSVLFLVKSVTHDLNNYYCDHFTSGIPNPMIKLLLKWYTPLPSLPTLGERLVWARKNIHIQEEIAADILEALPLSLLEWEAGTNRPTWNQLSAAAVLYDVPLRWLLSGLTD